MKNILKTTLFTALLASSALSAMEAGFTPDAAPGDTTAGLQGQTLTVLDAMVDAVEKTGIIDQKIKAITNIDIYIGDARAANMLQMSVVAPDVDMVIEAWRLVRDVIPALEQEAAVAVMAVDAEIKEGVAEAWELLGPIARLPEAVWAITTAEPAHRADRAQEWQFLGRIADPDIRGEAAADVAALAAQTPQQALDAAHVTNFELERKKEEERNRTLSTPAGQALDAAKAWFAAEMTVVLNDYTHRKTLGLVRRLGEYYAGAKLSTLEYETYSYLISFCGGEKYRAEARAAVDAAPDWQKIEMILVWHYITRSPSEAAFIEAKTAAEAAPSGQKTEAAKAVIIRHGYVQR